MTWFDLFVLVCLLLAVCWALGQRRLNRRFDAEDSRLWRAHSGHVALNLSRHSTHEKRISELEKLAAAPKALTAKPVKKAK